MAGELFLASVGFMPAGPRLAATRAVLRVCFFLRRKAAEEKKGLGRIADRMLRSCKLRLRRASPTVGLHSGRRGQDLQPSS